MKIRGSIIWFITIAVVLIVLVLWYGKKQSVATLPTASVETNTPPSATTAQRAPLSVPVRTNAPTGKTTEDADLSKSPTQSKTDRAIGLLSTYNDQPIVFYGKIEDQFSNAVPDAVVNFDVRVMNGYESTVKRGQAISDINGLFTVSGYKGQDLGIAVKKQGYVLVSMNGSGIYSKLWPEDQRAHPDANNPTVIKMWKLQGTEPLVSIDQHYKIHYTSTPINFDLLAAKIVPSGGDIKLTVSRSPGDISGRNRLDWSVQVEAVDGGVMDSGGQEGVSYAAPIDGYQPSMTFMFSTNAPYKWAGGFDQGFFVMSRNGQVYSKLGFGFEINIAPDDFMYITFGGVANANGSRNWEATAPQ